MKLKIKPIMNSPVEAIFGFKTCCGLRAFDQNLEILVRNEGDRPVTVQSLFDLVGPKGTVRETTLMPQGGLEIDPGDIKAFYCMMDEARWQEAREMILYDIEEHPYRLSIGTKGEEEK